MIQDQKTFDKYGYRISDLSYGSSKKVILSCDYCNKQIEKSYKFKVKQSEELDKDCCVDCKFKKREELSLLKYGVKNSSQRQDIKEKLTNYNIEEYKEEILKLFNDGYSMSNIGIKLNIPLTSLKRYLKGLGVDTRGNLQKKKEKTLEEKYGENYQQKMLDNRTRTNIDKFGCDNPFQNEEIKQKIKDTMITKYGYEHHMMNPDKIKQTQENNLKKYGYHNVAQIPEIKEKIKETNLEKYGYEVATKNSEVKQKIVSTMVSNGNAKLYEGLGAKIWAEKTGYCLSRFNQLVRQYGFETAKNMYSTGSYSSLELLFKSFLDQYNINYTQHFRILNNNKTYIADFKLNNNLLIECDGLYWHSEIVDLDNKYHVYKKEAYSNQGYDSLFFREDELRNKFEIVKSIVLNKLNKCERIFGRKCEIINLDHKTSDSFFENNHLMGKGRGDTYALTFYNKIVSALRLKRAKNNIYEISRFCSLSGYSVVGAFSKLLKKSIKDKNPDEIFTFIDRRYGKGEYLNSLGFQYVHTYPSFRWTDGFQTFHRLKFPGNSGYEKDLFKIYDCGQAKYSLWCIN